MVMVENSFRSSNCGNCVPIRFGVAKTWYARSGEKRTCRAPADRGVEGEVRGGEGAEQPPPWCVEFAEVRPVAVTPAASAGTIRSIGHPADVLECVMFGSVMIPP